MPESFEDIKARMDEIAQAVKDPDVALDDALGLYEEAVKLASRLSEAVSVDPKSLEALEDQSAGGEGAQAGASQAEPASGDPAPGDPA